VIKEKRVDEVLDYIVYKNEVYFMVSFIENNEPCFLSQKEMIERQYMDKILDFYENQVIRYFLYALIVRFDWNHKD